MTRIQYCQTCRFFESAPSLNAPPYVSHRGSCFRFPKVESKALNDQCGEWKFPYDRAERMCRAKGPVLRPATEGQPAITVRGAPVFPARPARPAIYCECALPKDHADTEHTNGGVSWKTS